MKPANQLLTGIVNQQGSASTNLTPVSYDRIEQPKTATDGDLMERVINDLFVFLKTQYSSFKNNYKTLPEVDAAKREWSKTLIENGVTSQEQIFIGKIAVRKQGGEWAPGPSDFCKMCIPQDLGIPEVTQAYYEAANAASHVKTHKWSHGIVYATGKQVGWFALKTEEAKKTKPEFIRIYKDMTSRMRMGEVFTAPEQVKTTENRLTVDAKKKTRTKTEQNKSARDLAMNSIKF